jgi:hypothetical protein
MAEEAMAVDFAQRLLIEAHRIIEGEAAERASRLVAGEPEKLVYPPNGGLLPEEFSALQALKGGVALESALRKVLADCAASTLFHVLSQIDAVASPEATAGDWSVIELRPVDEDAPDPSYGMLHDALYETYWNWRDLRRDTGWKLDNLDVPPSNISLQADRDR